MMERKQAEPHEPASVPYVLCLLGQHYAHSIHQGQMSHHGHQARKKGQSHEETEGPGVHMDGKEGPQDAQEEK